MKVLQIDLRAYGHYSNNTIRFDPKKNIHVIFGENEAGKTSFTRALQALLFGLEKKSSDTFLHSFEELYLEGLLQNSAGKFLKITRNSLNKRKQALLQLGVNSSFDKQTLINLFFLNQESIVLGSKDLIENIKHFDISLFTSIQGTQSILKTIKSSETEIENLYKPKGVKPLINQKLKLIEDLQEQKASLYLSIDKWKKLQIETKSVKEKKDALSKSTKLLLEELSKLKILEETYPPIEEYEKLSRASQLLNKDLIFEKEFLDKYFLLENQNSKHLSQQNLLKDEIEKIENDLNLLSYDSEIINKKSEFELLAKDYTEYEQLVKKEAALHCELVKTKHQYKTINLDLQKVIKTSFSLNDWERVRVNILEILEAFKLASKFHAKNLLIKENYEQSLEKFKRQKSLLEFSAVESDHKLLWNLENKAKLGVNLGQLSGEIDSLLTKVNKFSFLKQILTRNKTASLELSSRSQLLKFQKQYLALITRYKLNNEKLLESQSALLKFKGDESVSRYNCESKLSSYFKNKKIRQRLTASLLENWTAKNLNEKYASYLELKALLDEEDLVEKYLFDNLKYLSDATETIDLESRIKDFLAQEVQFKTDIRSFENSLYDNIPIFRLIKRVDFLDGAAVEEIFTFLDHIAELVSLLKEENTQIELISKAHQHLALSSPYGNLSELIHSLKEMIEKKKQSNTVIENFETEISALEKSLETILSEIHENNTSLEKLKKDWANVCSQFQIESSFDLKEIESLIKKMDNFFELSKVIKSDNLVLKNLMDKIKTYKSKFLSIFGFTDINPKVISMKILEVSKHENIKTNHTNLSFLKDSKAKELKNVIKEHGKVSKELKKLLLSFSIEECSLTCSNLNNSKSYFVLKDKLDQLKISLDLKCSGYGFEYFFEMFKLYSDSKAIVKLKNEKSNLINESKVRLTTLEKELGALSYRESIHYDFDKKHQLEKKIQTEIFELKNLLNSLLIAKTTVKFVKNTIWDFQEEFQRKILDKASTYFNELTDSRYVGLKLNFLDGKQSLLECTTASNKVLKISQLSEGTRDQLYLSLKFAFIEIYFANNEPFPLILDDILVNFDDTRARKCLKIIQMISKNAQIVFLTHHKHLIDLINNDLDHETFEIINLKKQSSLVAN
ncbi:MAG: hypothetical protein S4CHLAM6_11160 [Chlamydiae bacterium]|nr:hypothetical protein [Chlamydiota bacterium]